MAQWRNLQETPPNHCRRQAPFGSGSSSFLRSIFQSNEVGPQVAPSALSDISEQPHNSASEAFHIMTEGPLPGATAAAAIPIGPQLLLSGGRFTGASQSRAASGASGNSQRSAWTLFPSPSSRKLGSSTGQTQSQAPETKGNHHHHHQHRTAARIEFKNGIKLVKRNFLSCKPWRDGVMVMWIVVSNTFTSLVVAWAVALLYAMGYGESAVCNAVN